MALDCNRKHKARWLEELKNLPSARKQPTSGIRTSIRVVKTTGPTISPSESLRLDSPILFNHRSLQNPAVCVSQDPDTVRLRGSLVAEGLSAASK